MRRLCIQTEECECVYLYVANKNGGDSGTLNPECPWGELSAKAVHAQDILSGVASKIGGDHTQDLSRLLRLPGTLNRKDQRNGKEPLPCEIAECDPKKRYPLADIERFASVSPCRQRREAVAKMRLPTVRKLSPSKQDQLDQLVNECAAAPIGARSDRDWHLICFAIEKGIGPEEVWQRVADIGKFAEKGRAYFDRTWLKAEGHTRLKLYDRAERKTAEKGTPLSSSGGSPEGPAQEGYGDGSAGDVDEALTDPHRLADAWLRIKAMKEHPGDSAAFYRNQYWRWRETHWRAIPDNELKADLNLFVRNNLVSMVAASEDGDEVPSVTRELVSNVLAAIEARTVIPQETQQPCWRGSGKPAKQNWIALKNGILDVDAFPSDSKEVLRPHSPRWFSPTCLPYPFDPNADCPLWQKFLTRNLGDDPAKQQLLQQWCGYLLLHDTTQQQFLVMVGEGSNGKSVACEVITALLGEDNVGTEPLELFGDKFRLVNTLGKLANITAEVGELDKMAEGYLKAFIVGDPMTFEQKFKQSFTARPTARLMLATNNVPCFSDKSDGIWRRMILLPFVMQINKSEAVPGMDKREFWQEKGELPGIFNWALAGLAGLKKEGRFIIPQSCQGAADEVRLENNTARLFLLENYEAGQESVFKQAIYRHYADWCKDRNYHALADRGFGKEVKRAFRSVKDGKEYNPATAGRENTYTGLQKRKDDELSGGGSYRSN